MMVELCFDEDINYCRDDESLNNGDCRCNVPWTELNNWAMISGYYKQFDWIADNGVSSLDSTLMVNILYYDSFVLLKTSFILLENQYWI